MIGPDFPAVLASAVGGDEEAFVRLWRDVHPALVRYLSVLAPGGAEDAAADTWLQVLPGLGRFRGDEAGFRAWVFTIARRKVIDGHRRRGRRPEQPLDDRDFEPAVVGDAADGALERLSTRWALDLIATLPTDHAEIVLLRVIAGLDVAAVAKLVGRSAGAVRVTQHRALRRLAETLERAAAPEATGPVAVSKSTG